METVSVFHSIFLLNRGSFPQMETTTEKGRWAHIPARPVIACTGFSGGSIRYVVNIHFGRLPAFPSHVGFHFGGLPPHHIPDDWSGFTDHPEVISAMKDDSSTEMWCGDLDQYLFHPSTSLFW